MRLGRGRRGGIDVECIVVARHVTVRSSWVRDALGRDVERLTRVVEGASRSPPSLPQGPFGRGEEPATERDRRRRA
jgi:hypothetical protein